METHTRVADKLLRLWRRWTALLFLPVLLSGCGGPVYDKSPWAQEVLKRFEVTSRRLPSTGRVAVVVRDRSLGSPGPAPAPYQGTVEFLLDPAKDPAAESGRLTEALEALLSGKVKGDVYAEGVPGLLLRHASARLKPNPNLGRIVLVDVPNRGLSSSGWPQWSGRPPPPGWTLSGSGFLRELNRAPAAAKASSDPFINIWRRQQDPASRASVLPVSRQCLALVVEAPSRPFWNLLKSPVEAARAIPEGGLPPRKQHPGGVRMEAEAEAYGARPQAGSAPGLIAVIDKPSLLPREIAAHWIAFAQTARADRDQLSRFTDIIGARWLDQGLRLERAGRPGLLILGFEDYFRDPLRLDFLTAAIPAYRDHQTPAISIDPRRPSDPEGQMPVRFEGPIAKTYLGGTMFEADRVMKILGLGIDNITRTAVESDVPGYRPVAGIHEEERFSAGAWRLWWEPARWHGREPDPLTFIPDASFSVNWEKLSRDYRPSPAVQHFTASLNNNFPLYAQEQPSLDQLSQLANVLALANWIAEADIPIEFSPPNSRVGTPLHTPLVAVRHTATSGASYFEQTMEGGTVSGPGLRHVRQRIPEFDVLTGRAMAQLYPPSLANPPPSPGVLPSVRRNLPPMGPRAPPLTAGFSSDNVVYRAALFDGDTVKARAGILVASDAIQSRPLSVEEIIQNMNKSPQIEGAEIGDSVLQLSGSNFGSEPGELLLDRDSLPIEKWSDGQITASLNSTLPPESRLVVLTKGGLRGELKLLSGVVPGPRLPGIPGAGGRSRIRTPETPPKLTVHNPAQSTITIKLVPLSGGSEVELTLDPGGSVTREVPEGSFRLLVDGPPRLRILGLPSIVSFQKGGTYIISPDSQARKPAAGGQSKTGRAQ